MVSPRFEGPFPVSPAAAPIVVGPAEENLHSCDTICQRMMRGGYRAGRPASITAFQLSVAGGGWMVVFSRSVIADGFVI